MFGGIFSWSIFLQTRHFLFPDHMYSWRDFYLIKSVHVSLYGTHVPVYTRCIYTGIQEYIGAENSCINTAIHIPSITVLIEKGSKLRGSCAGIAERKPNCVGAGWHKVFCSFCALCCHHWQEKHWI